MAIRGLKHRSSRSVSRAVAARLRLLAFTLSGVLATLLSGCFFSTSTVEAYVIGVSQLSADTTGVGTTAGVVANLTFRAADRYRNAIGAYRGTVRISSSDSQATMGDAALPLYYTFTAADEGIHTFAVVLKTAGAQTVTITDGGMSASAAVTVTANVFNKFTITGLPVPLVAGNTTSFTVNATDAYGNVVTTYTGTADFSTNDNAANLTPFRNIGVGAPAQTAQYIFVSSDRGSKTFTNALVLWTANDPNLNSPTTITIEDVAKGKSASPEVPMAPAAAHHFHISATNTVAPADDVAENAVQPVTTASSYHPPLCAPATYYLVVHDAYNNTKWDYLDRVSLSTVTAPDLARMPTPEIAWTLPGTTALPGTYTFTGTDRGHAYLANKMVATYTSNLRVTFNNGATDSVISLVPGAAITTAKFIATPTSPLRVDYVAPTQNLTVAPRDGCNVLAATGDSTTVMWSSDNPYGTFNSTGLGTATLTWPYGAQTFNITAKLRSDSTQSVSIKLQVRKGSWENGAAGPTARYDHAMAVNGATFCIWGGIDNTGYLNTGSCYATGGGAWTPMNDPPANTVVARSGHSMVYDPVNSRYIVWGGYNPTDGYLGDGWMYDGDWTWGTNTTPTRISMLNSPSPRTGHFAQWITWPDPDGGGPLAAGAGMLIYGGWDGVNYLNDGAIYLPGTNTWVKLSASSISPRSLFSGFWNDTDARFYVWGGLEAGTYSNDGAFYDPAARTWTNFDEGVIGGTSITARAGHASAFLNWGAGIKGLAFWGGTDGSSYLHDGAIYDRTQAAGSRWLSRITTDGAPAGRTGHTALAYTAPADDRLVVFGGISGSDSTGSQYIGEIGVYNPLSDQWDVVSDGAYAVTNPSPRAGHTATIIGNYLYIVGGRDATGPVANVVQRIDLSAF